MNFPPLNEREADQRFYAHKQNSTLSETEREILTLIEDIGLANLVATANRLAEKEQFPSVPLGWKSFRDSE